MRVPRKGCIAFLRAPPAVINGFPLAFVCEWGAMLACTSAASLPATVWSRRHVPSLDCRAHRKQRPITLYSLTIFGLASNSAAVLRGEEEASFETPAVSPATSGLEDERRSF